MEILNDTTKTQVVHTRTVLLSNAPMLDTRNYYGPAEMYRPEKLTVKWVGDAEPESVWVEGTSESNLGIQRSFGWEQMPEWMAGILKPDTSVALPEAVVPVAKPRLVRKRVGDRMYEIHTKDGKLVGNAAMTGEHGRDNYPWDWYLSDELAKQLRESDAPKHHKSGGSSDSLRDIIDMMASKIARYGLKP